MGVEPDKNGMGKKIAEARRNAAEAAKRVKSTEADATPEPDAKQLGQLAAEAAARKAESIKKIQTTKDSIIANTFGVKAETWSEEMLGLVESYVVGPKSQPHDAHGDMDKVGKHLAKDIADYVEKNKISLEEGIRALTTAAAIYSEDQATARQFVAQIKTLVKDTINAHKPEERPELINIVLPATIEASAHIGHVLNETTGLPEDVRISQQAAENVVKTMGEPEFFGKPPEKPPKPPPAAQEPGPEPDRPEQWLGDPDKMPPRLAQIVRNAYKKSEADSDLYKSSSALNKLRGELLDLIPDTISKGQTIKGVEATVINPVIEKIKTRLAEVEGGENLKEKVSRVASDLERRLGIGGNPELVAKLKFETREANTNLQTALSTTDLDLVGAELYALATRAQQSSDLLEMEELTKKITNFELSLGSPFKETDPDLLAREQTKQAAQKKLAELAKDVINYKKQYYSMDRELNVTLESRMEDFGFKETERADVRKWFTDPARAAKEIISASNPQAAFAELERVVSLAYYKLYQEAVSHPLSKFEEHYNFLRHQPFEDLIQRSLYQLVQELDTAGVKTEILVLRTDKDTQLPNANTKVKVSEAVLDLMQLKEAEKRLIQVAHDGMYVLRLGLGAEEMTGFLRSFKTSDIGLLLLRDADLGVAMRIASSCMDRQNDLNAFRVDPTLMSLDRTTFRDKFYDLVKGQLKRELFGKYGAEPSEWQLDRLTNMSIGFGFVATGELLDRQAMCMPPSMITENVGFTSLFAENMLMILNPNFIPNRFYQRVTVKGEGPDPVFVAMSTPRFGRHRLRGFDVNERIRWVENRADMPATWYLIGTPGAPLSEEVNPNGVGSGWARGGWRTTAQTLHLVVAPHTRENVSWTWREVESENEVLTQLNEKLGQIDWNNVNWNQTWDNFRKAGPAIMWHWVNNLPLEDPRGKPRKEFKSKIIDWFEQQGMKEVIEKRLHVKDLRMLKGADLSKALKYGARMMVMTHERSVNPLRFILFDSPYRFNQRNLRFGINKSDYKPPSDALRNKIKQRLGGVLSDRQTRLTSDNQQDIEADMALITNRLYAWNSKSIDDITDEQLQEIYRILGYGQKDVIAAGEKRAVEVGRYWDAATEAITEDTIVEAAHIEYPYSYGTSGVNHEYINYAAAGESVMRRNMNDLDTVGKGAVMPFLDIRTLLSEIQGASDQDHALEAIDKYLASGFKAINDVNGMGAARAWCERQLIIIDTYFGKSYWAKIPFVGWFLGLITEESLSQKSGGGLARSWDEGVLYTVNQNVARKKGRIDAKGLSRVEADTASGPISGFVGMSFDFIRSALPIPALLIFLGALKVGEEEAEKQSKSS